MLGHAKLPKKGLKIAHINICSIRNKITEVTEILMTDQLHILAISETHLDSTFEDSVLNIQGYNIVRKDRNAYGGGVDLFIQDHLPMRIRNDLMPLEVEALWLQIHSSHLKPLLIGCCYRPPSANSSYLDMVCEMLENACNLGFETYFMGDLNIDWQGMCPMRNKLQCMASACGLIQVVDKPTRIKIRSDGTQTSTCIDHIFTNAAELCSKVISVPAGCSDHNLVALARRTKMPKPGPKVIMKRSYKNFDQIKFREEVSGLCWSEVLMETNPDSALMKFNNVFMKVVEKHAPIKKFTVRSINTPWLDNELKEYMTERNQAKLIANRSNFKSDWQVYRKLRNFVTKLNKKKKKVYYENKINEIKNDSRKVWSTLNSLMGKSHRSTPSFLETEGHFLTKPTEIANYLNNYFIKKIDDLRNNFQDIDNVINKR